MTYADKQDKKREKIRITILRDYEPHDGWNVDFDIVVNQVLALFEDYVKDILSDKILICPECGQYKPEDERVQNNMKCGLCAKEWGLDEKES